MFFTKRGKEILKLAEVVTGQALKERSEMEYYPFPKITIREAVAELSFLLDSLYPLERRVIYLAHSDLKESATRSLRSECGSG